VVPECWETEPVARTVRASKRVEFNVEEPAELVGYMSLIADARDGWINLIPEVGDEERSTTLGFMALFGGGSTGVTMCTWKPERADQSGRRQVSLGISHATGRRFSVLLPPLAIPRNWVVKQDHPQRGLVLFVPDSEPHERVLDWALHALRVLSPPAGIEKWRAEIYLPAN
jgi:hypothetical protein